MATLNNTIPNPTAAPPVDVIVIGAGLAGLACAKDLVAAGLTVRLLEAADAPGGRIRTDVIDGFRLDRGFQVLLTDYPEARRVLDYEALSLKNFASGALVRHAGKLHRFADPSREFGKALAFAFDPVIPLGDKLRVRSLRSDCLRSNDTDLFTEAEESTREYLRGRGFTPAIIERFFEPFFGGVFLERNLTTSSRWFRWLFRIFSTGYAAVPELGMEQIPRQLAAALPPEVLLCNAEVKRIERTATGWSLDIGDRGFVDSRHIVMAAREGEAKTLLAKIRKPGAAPPRVWNKTTTFYYAANHAPVDEPVLVLNGEGAAAGPINHLAVMSLLSPSYAPPGAHLICANVVGAAPESGHAMEVLEAEMRVQLRRWFGNQVNNWGVLAGYPIAHALPFQASYQQPKPVPVDAGIFLCGDYVGTASIQGALLSGANAASAVQAAIAKNRT